MPTKGALGPFDDKGIKRLLMEDEEMVEKL